VRTQLFSVYIVCCFVLNIYLKYVKKFILIEINIYYLYDDMDIYVNVHTCYRVSDNNVYL
jgi:hypothetical protein